MPSPLAEYFAKDWFTIHPKYRTRDRLAAHIQDALNICKVRGDVDIIRDPECSICRRPVVKDHDHDCE